uniref:Centrosomin N-terminal motif 1 domain-containing protein n=1 Tax=Seriola lalandi dorsalis TaxID=1841481 RepID=A0A3B4YEZ2_SERLL
MRKVPVIMSNSGFRGCRTISQHLNDLKKENFSLKLRIYFLEEKIQQKFEESSDDVHKRVSQRVPRHMQEKMTLLACT